MMAYCSWRFINIFPAVAIIWSISARLLVFHPIPDESSLPHILFFLGLLAPTVNLGPPGPRSAGDKCLRFFVLFTSSKSPIYSAKLTPEMNRLAVYLFCTYLILLPSLFSSLCLYQNNCICASAYFSGFFTFQRSHQLARILLQVQNAIFALWLTSVTDTQL